MNLDNISDAQFTEQMQDVEHATLVNLLGQYGGQERRRDIILAEIQKRQLHNIYKSSESLRVLTKVLIVLTIILAILAVPPFVETIRNLCQ